MLRLHAYDAILVDRGTPVEACKWGDHRNRFDMHEDAKPFAQAIKGYGELPNFCRSIQSQNKNAKVFLTSGIQDDLPDHLNGIDVIVNGASKTNQAFLYVLQELGLDEYGECAEMAAFLREPGCNFE